MKKILSHILILTLFFWGTSTQAQTDPGTANLTHQWTFDDGTANDAIETTPVNGVLKGAATIEDFALKLSSNGDYLSFSGSSLNLKSYSAISQEIWYTSVEGANGGYTMLSYFGNTNTSDGLGYNYLSTSTARGDDVSRTTISDGTYNSEIGANGPEYDDGVLHQMVSVINADSVILYLDGALVSKTANTIALSTIGTSLAYLGKSGYSNDPTWIGSISKFSIYNKSLSADEVKFLYQDGPESTAIISSSVKALGFDNLHSSETIKITGANLDSTIFITTPSGITVSPDTLPSNAEQAAVTVSYDGTSSIDGNIVMTSGSGKLNIPVKSYTNDCFSQLYPNVSNLIPDPYVSDLSNFAGWGNKSINSDPDYVYCGATSGKVSGTNGGSLDVTLTGKLKPNTQYRVKAEVYVIGGAFQLGIFGWSNGQGDFNRQIKTTDSWQDVDFTFTTGATLGSTQGIFFNNYDLSGNTGFIDNWEMYAVPKVYTSSSALEFPTQGSQNVTIRSVNLSEDIKITAPEGFTVSPSSMTADANGDVLTVTFNGTESNTGYIYFNSGSAKDSLQVSGSADPTIVTSASYVIVDEISTSTNFRITGYNLTNAILLNAPSGITISPTSLPATASNSSVTVTYDGNANSSGYLTISSGDAIDSIQIFAERNDNCFTQLYPDNENLIVDPTCNYYLTDGWGSKSINANPDFVYCGSRSGKVTNNGSLNRNLTGILKPNTTYRMKAEVYKASETGQNMGKVTYTLAFDSAAHPEPYRLIKTAMDSACYYFNKYTPFIKNIRVVYNAGVPTAQANYHGEIDFGANTRYMWVGTAMHEMCHYFGSGTTNEWEAKMVNGVWTGTVADALIKSINGGEIHGDTQHFWPYGINQKEEVTNLGSIAAQQEALATTAKIAKAMLVDDCGLPTNNPPVGVGVYGWNAAKGDIYHEVTVPNSWQDVDFTFTTGSSLKASQGVFFSSGTGYIDNWELYQLSADALLSDLQSDGTTVGGFDAKTLNYDVELSAGTTQVPKVTATATDANAGIKVTETTELPGKTTIVVTAEDGITTTTYTVNFKLITGVADIDQNKIMVYPTISSGKFKVKTTTNSAVITVYNMLGNIVSKQRSDDFETNISVPSAGLYILKIQCNEVTKTVKVIKTN